MEIRLLIWLISIIISFSVMILAILLDGTFKTYWGACVIFACIPVINMITAFLATLDLIEDYEKNTGKKRS